MNTTAINTLVHGALLAAGFVCATAATAQPAWKPDRNIEILVPSAAGGGFDRTGRTIQKVAQARKLIDVSMSINNKSGGGGAIGWAYLSQFKGDAHHIGICSPTLLTNQITGSNNISHTDFTPLAMLYNEYLAFAVKADSPIKTGKELLERLANTPGSLSIAIGTAPGGPNHVGVAIVLKGARADLRKQKIAFFKTGGDSLTALLGGHVDVMASTPGNLVQALESKQIRVIAIGAARRQSGDFAQVPTWKEYGVEGQFPNWRCVIGPRGFSAAQTAYWENVLERVAGSDEWKEELEQNIAEGTFMKSAATRKFFESEFTTARRVLGELGLAK
jgi:putative tricarboxylic transport membrane protein